MKKLFVSVFIAGLSQLHGQSQLTAREKSEMEYLVNLNNDTLYGKFGMAVTHTLDNGNKYRFTPKGGEKMTVTAKEAKAARIDGIDYYCNLRQPQFGEKGARDFLKVMLQKDAFRFCGVPLPNGEFDYILFENDKFVQDIKRGNYEEVIQKYFTGCKAIDKGLKLGYTKYKDLGQLSQHYYEYEKKCK